MLPFDEIARANPEYVDALYREYLRDPAAVDERWALVFAGFDLALRDGARSGGSVAELVHAYRELGHLVAISIRSGAARASIRCCGCRSWASASATSTAWWTGRRSRAAGAVRCAS